MYDRNPMIEPKGAEWKRVEVRDAAQRSTHGSGDGNGRPLAESPMLTTATGAPAGTQQALTAGPRGPLLAQDAMLLEAMQHFNRERIAPRVVHAKGAGAYGVFTVTGDITRYTRAAFLGAVGRRTEVFVRFSVLAADQGAADSTRDLRGFAVRFYTPEGNWDLVGGNTPVSIVRDPFRFQSFVHARRRHPQSNLPDRDMLWDFYSQCPETLHQITMIYSDRGLPSAYRFMNGYGAHAFSLINAKGERTWCKFHLTSRQGVRNLDDAAATELAGRDPDSASRDLFEAIARGEHPRWRVCVQAMTEDQARGFRWNPFDVTKVWPHGQYPLIEIGELELDRNPIHHFAEVEQAAFKPGAFVPGIGPSPDKMLQARLLAYADAQHHRLGVNHHQIPVNAPRCPVMGFIRDGLGALGEQCGMPGYWPNTIAGSPQPQPSADEPMWHLGDTTVDRYEPTDRDDDFTQPGELYRRFDAGQRERLAARIAVELREARMDIRLRQLRHFFRADEDYGRRVAERLGIDVGELCATVDAAGMRGRRQTTPGATVGT
jgi:catalase